MIETKFRNFYGRHCPINYISMLILILSIDAEIAAQCVYSPVIATNYFTGICGTQHTQNMIGVQVPIYGNNGTLFFTSPLTDRVVISSTNDGPIHQLRIFPNPAFDILQIEWPNDQAADIHIYSPLGQLISKSRIDAFSISTIDIQHLLPGYYIVKAVTPQNQTFISKLIKQ